MPKGKNHQAHSQMQESRGGNRRYLKEIIDFFVRNGLTLALRRSSDGGWYVDH